MSRWIAIALAGGLVLAAGCQDEPEPVDFFAFQRPRHLAFACYDTRNEQTARLSEAVERPLSCCGDYKAADDSDYCGETPRLHALVTQSRRGEMAAVNVGAERNEDQVVDSDPTIPGFTFTDVGELPAAVVVPEQDLLNAKCGPRWTYVASAGEREVRAVATCRFRRGVECGPELALGTDFVALSRVVLPSEPGDMIVDEQGFLWISLPNEQALGRIRLNDGSGLDALRDGGAAEIPEDLGCDVPGQGDGDPGDADAGASDVDVRQALHRPFLPGDDGEVLQLFPLGADGGLGTLTLPLVEDDDYTAWCGLGSDSSFEGDRILQPPASVADVDLGDGGPDGGTDGGVDGGVEAGMDGGTDGGMEAGVDAGMDAGMDGGMDAGMDGGAGPGADGGVAGPGDILPNRLRYDPESNLLLASDLRQPFIHAWRIRADEQPEPVASIATGAPIWDFALTGAVPSRVDLYVDGEPNDGFPPNDVRYIYAIDDRDKSVLAIRWRPADDGSGSVELVRPQGPVRHADRLFLSEEQATALEIIDTRSNDPGACNGPDGAGDAESLGLTTRQSDPGALLRGVFLAVATSSRGGLQIFDVHDQDLFCESFGRQGGTGRCNPDDPTQPASGQPNDEPLGMSVRRHSRRLQRAQPVEGTGDRGELGEVACPDGYLGLDTEAEDTGPEDPEDEIIRLCFNRDPYMQFGDTWSVVYEQFLPTSEAGEPSGNLGQGRFDGDESEEGRGYFRLTAGFDICARGVVDAEALAAEPDAYPGDYLVLPDEMPPGAPDDCRVNPQGDLPRFPILEAYADHLIVGQRSPEDAEDGRMSLQEARRCYAPRGDAADGVASGFTDFGIQVRGRHLVLGQNLGYLHRVISDDSGRCVLDPERDPRLRARVRVATDEEECGQAPFLFQNPYVAFCPYAPESGASPTSLRLNLRLTRVPDPLADRLSTDTGLATLPETLRYLPITRQLYVVDEADQGLLQWRVRPLELVQAFR